MKLFFCMAVSLFLAINSLYAAPSDKSRIQIESIVPRKVILIPGSVEGGTIGNTSSKGIRAVFPAEEEWKKGSFTFNPEEDGSLYLQLMGEWASVPEDRSWIIFDKVSATGTTIPNGDFEENLRHWWKCGKDKLAEIVDENSDNGKKAVKVNHDNPVAVKIEVRKNHPVTVTFFYKIAE